MRTRYPGVVSIFMPIMIGCIGFSNLARQPGFASFRNVDVVTLVAAGMCFGVALTGMFALLRERRSASAEAS